MYGVLHRMADRFYLECEKCDGVATIEHDQDHHFYQIKFCPFCGAESLIEEEDAVFDNEENEDDWN